MPVTTYPAPHGSSPVKSVTLPPQTLDPTSYSESIFRKVTYWTAEDRENLGLHLQSSFCFSNPSTPKFPILGTQNGFVNTCIKAYFNHHHLRIRPDDVWISILTQLHMYIKAHSEELRSIFVDHEGKKELTIVIPSDNTVTGQGLPFVYFVQQMIGLMQDNIVDEGFKDWVMPDFSTTTDNDRMVAGVVFMGTMSKYFDYTMMSLCGLPSVTLLGEKSDYELILSKLSKIPSLGPEPKKFHDLLVPILKRFILTFDSPTSDETKEFWQRIVYELAGGSGPSYYNGWIIAFSFWDAEGKVLHRDFGDRVREEKKMVLDGEMYGFVKNSGLCQGWVGVDVKVNDEEGGGGLYGVKLIAGSVGMELESSGDHGAEYDVVKPVLGWWPFREKDEGKEEEGDGDGDGDGDGEEMSPYEAEKRIRKLWEDMAAPAKV